VTRAKSPLPWPCFLEKDGRKADGKAAGSPYLHVLWGPKNMMIYDHENDDGDLTMMMIYDDI